MNTNEELADQRWFGIASYDKLMT